MRMWPIRFSTRSSPFDNEIRACSCQREVVRTELSTRSELKRGRKELLSSGRGSEVMEAPTSLTVSQREQILVQDRVYEIYNIFSSIPPNCQNFMLELQRDNHMEFLVKGLKKLGPSFAVLDANRPWICYWILHSIALLGEFVDEELETNAIDFLTCCQDPNGGYGGGPGQLQTIKTSLRSLTEMPHLATTYAAVNALVTLGSEKSLSSINRDKLYDFLRRMKDTSGAFGMHDAGEIDVRACYTAISVASMLNMLDLELVQNLGNYIVSCQTYEGGIAGEPGSEAHGGYTFCGLASMILINEVNRLDLASLVDWVVSRQGVELGFQGRANKLVDGCYSFWQGGAFVLLQRLNSVISGQLGLSVVGEGEWCLDSPQSNSSSDISEIEEEEEEEEEEKKEEKGPGSTCCRLDACHVDCTSTQGHAKIRPLFDSLALQKYLLLCSQDQEGGFRDKPGKYRDFYHTCYCLSGLSVCQYSWSTDDNSPPLPKAVLGPYSNLVEPVHPLYNVVLARYQEARQFFSSS